MFFENYNKMHSYYTKKDGIIAIAVALVSSLLFYIAGIFLRENGMRMFIPASVIIIIIVLALVLLRKEELRTLGVHLKGWWQSALLGLILGALFFFTARFLLDYSVFERAYGGAEVMRLGQGDRFIDVPEAILISWLPMALLFIFITVVSQELLFRSYIQTRLLGLLKSDLAATVITGFLFALFFMPLHTILMGQSFSWVFMVSIPLPMFWLFALHCWLNLLYRTYNNIAAPVVFHIFFSLHSNIALTHSYFMGLA